MRLLIFILLLPCFCQSQIAGVFPSVVHYTSGVRTLVLDNFNDVALSSHWKPRKPAQITLNQSAGSLRMIGSSSAKDLSLILTDTTFGYTVQRSYTMEAGFRINNISSNTTGFYIGARSINTNYSFEMSSYGFVDLNNDSLYIATSNDTLIDGRRSAVTTGLPAFNTTDYYRLRFWVVGDSARTTIVNVSTGDSVTTGIKYNFSAAGSIPLRPNTFYYGLGVSKSTDVSVDYFRVTTEDDANPEILVIGNSITVGYAAGTSDSSYAGMLARHTNKSLEIFAGSGATLLDLYGIKEKVAGFNPQTCLMGLGTNGGGTVTDYENFVSYLEGQGITCYQLATPNGGNPATSGTWNYNVKAAFPSTFIDVWTTGWNTMSVGDMYDSVHPTQSGSRKIANVIRAALPLIFWK